MSDRKGTANSVDEPSDSFPDYEPPAYGADSFDGEALEGRVTTRVKRPPLMVTRERLGHRDYFEPETEALLQLLPSGTCIPAPVRYVTVLGRTVPTLSTLGENEELIDLNPFQAYQHGVSRRHVLFKRQDGRLIVVDLGAANGTYLNGERLQAYQEYSITHGDELILGTLRIRVTFSENGTPLLNGSQETSD